MCRPEPAATGEWGRVVWAVEASGKRPALEFFEQLREEQAAKMQVLFERLAEHGQITNREHFKKLENLQGHAICEFKRHQIRFLGRYGPGKQFLVAHGLQKKQNKHRPTDLHRTARILTEHLARHEQGG